MNILDALGGDDAIARWLGIGLLVAARVVPLTFFAPWFSSRAAPAMLRTALSLAFTVALFPIADASAPALPGSSVVLVAYALREALIGSMYAVASSVVLVALDWSGRLIDTWRGANLAEVMAPGAIDRTSPLGAFSAMFGVAVFVALGGHRIALATFGQGLIRVPVGATGDIGNPVALALGAASLVGETLAFALSLAAPAAVALLITEVALGLVARASPQIPVFFAGMPIRAALGVAAVLISLSAMMDLLPEAFRVTLEAARAVFP